MTDEARKPSLTALLKRAGSSLLKGMHVTLPARVERYDAAKECVDAQPWIHDEVEIEGVATVERLPVVTNCPVVFPRSGPYGITFPVALGSTVILHFTSVGMDRWLAIGGEVAPEDGRKLTLNDAFAVPGGHSFAGVSAPSTTAPTDAMVLHAAALKLGGPAATSEIARKLDLTQFMTILNGVVDSSGACAALHAALTLAGWPACASTVKAL